MRLRLLKFKKFPKKVSNNFQNNSIVFQPFPIRINHPIQTGPLIILGNDI
jgi:hypothetical protein